MDRSESLRMRRPDAALTVKVVSAVPVASLFTSLMEMRYRNSPEGSNISPPALMTWPSVSRRAPARRRRCIPSIRRCGFPGRRRRRRRSPAPVAGIHVNPREAAVKAAVRTFRHPSGLQHRYYRAELLEEYDKRSSTEAGTRRRSGKRTEEVAELMVSTSCSV